MFEVLILFFIYVQVCMKMLGPLWNQTVNLKQTLTLYYRLPKLEYGPRIWSTKETEINICILNSLSAANYFNVFCHVTLKNHISGVIYSSISSYTSLEREKNTLSKKKYFGHRKPIIFRHKKIKKAYFA